MASVPKAGRAPPNSRQRGWFRTSARIGPTEFGVRRSLVLLARCFVRNLLLAVSFLLGRGRPNKLENIETNFPARQSAGNSDGSQKSELCGPESGQISQRGFRIVLGDFCEAPLEARCAPDAPLRARSPGSMPRALGCPTRAPELAPNSAELAPISVVSAKGGRGFWCRRLFRPRGPTVVRHNATDRNLSKETPGGEHQRARKHIAHRRCGHSVRARVSGTLRWADWWVVSGSSSQG